MLLGYEKGGEYGAGQAPLELPDNVFATEYLTMEGKQFSSSRQHVIYLRDFLDRYDPDALRYYLVAAGPETQDADFTWAEFVRRNNDELLANWGNLVNRTLTNAHRNFGAVPDPGALTAEDQAVLAGVEGGFETVGALIEEGRFRAALAEAMRLATHRQPVRQRPGPLGARQDRSRAGGDRPLRLAPRRRQPEDDLHAVPASYLAAGARAARVRRRHRRAARVPRSRRGRRVASDPDRRLRDRGSARGQPSELPAGQTLQEPRQLFKKLDDSVVEDELQRMRDNDE